VALALSGCAVGPHYATPTPPAPSTPAFVSATPAATSADQPSPTWWRLYEDPAIDPLVREALVHNNNLLVAAGNLAEARGALALANAGRFPATTISAGAQYGVTADKQLADEIRGLGPASPGWLYTAGLDVSYEVDLFGRVRKTIQAAKADYEAQQAAEDVVRVSVAGETTRAYLNACAYARWTQSPRPMRSPPIRRATAGPRSSTSFARRSRSNRCARTCRPMKASDARRCSSSRC
jgi:outer membrane protein TolC